MFRSLFLICALGAASVLTPARAEVTNCTNITSLPAVISTQGVYCLKQDLQTAISSGAAITINTNNVTIDCNDWKIGGLQAGASTTAIGIKASARLNLTVRHCGVRGFRTGISFTDNTGAGHLIEDNRIDLNTAVGIEVYGDGNIVRRNRIVDTGGLPNGTSSTGLSVSGTGAVVASNLINGVTVTGNNASVYGINVFGSNHEFSGNVITGLLPTGTGVARGIYGDGWASYRDNTITSAGSTTNGYGIDLFVSTSMCSGNRVHGFSTGIDACADGGGNLSN